MRAPPTPEARLAEDAGRVVQQRALQTGHGGAHHRAHVRVAHQAQGGLRPGVAGPGVLVDEGRDLGGDQVHDAADALAARAAARGHDLRPRQRREGIAGLGRSGHEHAGALGRGRAQAVHRRLGAGVDVDGHEHHGQARERVGAVRRHPVRQHPPALVEAQQPQAVEDRRRVPQGLGDGAGVHPAGGELVLEPDGRLGDALEAEAPRDGQDLEVERVALDQHHRQHLVEHLAPEQLHPDLRVAHVEGEHGPHQLLVEPGVDPAARGVGHLGLGVALGPDHHVQPPVLGRGEEGLDAPGVEVQVRVDPRDPLAGRRRRAGPQRVALAHVAVVPQRPHALVVEGGGLGVGVVGAAVRDDHHLEVEPLRLQAPRDLAQVVLDRLRLVEGRHDHRELGAGHRGAQTHRGASRRAMLDILAPVVHRSSITSPCACV